MKAGATKRPGLKSGTLLVVGLLAVFVAGWFVYRLTIPPAWLRDLGQEIALRATPDPNAPPPEDSRQVTPRGLAASPYICLGRAIHRPWDRLVVVPSGADARQQPILAAAEWPSDDALAAFAEKVSHDPRYQGVVLLADNKVVASELFFTFWADLSALARPEGFSPADAIFTARVAGGTYVLSIPAEIPQDACG